MKHTQLNRGLDRRLMYVEAKAGLIEGAQARIGWVTFSRSGRSLRCRNLTLARLEGGGSVGNYADEATGDEFWVSGVKRRGSNSHPAERGVAIVVDDDALAACHTLRGGA